MEKDPIPQLLALCDAYAGYLNISHWRVSFLARGDGGFFSRLRAGRGCTTRTARIVFQWFSDNWPPDLEWPRDIPRPRKLNPKEAA